MAVGGKSAYIPIFIKDWQGNQACKMQLKDDKKSKQLAGKR